MARPKYAPRGPVKAKADQMSPPDPMCSPVGGDMLHGRQRCTATSKQKGVQCGRTAIPGGRVCRYHGGLAPQVQKAAKQRLLEYQDRAVARLFELAEQQAFPSTAYAAVRDILDRTMGKPAESVAVEHSGGLVIRHEIPE